ncbi:hypothetical protein DEJ49_33125 [Streptomyces venezuelae]|uniref:Uncharacterized protein n=1 Tax=Streptomyces venezuelae TaxID=54571 RepID=A0A5P2CQR2_STRVZ|nr:hypothetical protein DEJ49_33125 [Streptomyces venezuelae]
MSDVPETYLGAAVPDDIKKQWRRWEGAEWRKAQYRATNRLYPPDERFNVRAPEGMCERHWDMRIGYRNMHFDPVTGDRWPGHPGSLFIVIGSDLNAVREERRCEWDEKASEQMQLIERICLSGRSPQCTPRETS